VGGGGRGLGATPLHPTAADDARLIAAAVSITIHHQPQLGLELLDGLAIASLKDARRERALTLRKEAERMQRAGAAPAPTSAAGGTADGERYEFQ
jgi:hypothetical protein